MQTTNKQTDICIAAVYSEHLNSFQKVGLRTHTGLTEALLT